MKAGNAAQFVECIHSLPTIYKTPGVVAQKLCVVTHTCNHSTWEAEVGKYHFMGFL